MKNNYFKIVLLLICLIAFSQITFGQYGTTKFCPNTPAWKANKSMVENAQGMYNDYAKGPDGCWWMKIAKFSSYPEGFYQFTLSGTKYYYNKKKAFWENANRTVCIESPFGK